MHELQHTLGAGHDSNAGGLMHEMISTGSHRLPASAAEPFHDFGHDDLDDFFISESHSENQTALVPLL